MQRWCIALALACGCGGASAPPPSAKVSCANVSGKLPGDVELAECTDGRARELSCQRSPMGERDEEVFCACMLAGKLGASFVLFSDSVDAAVDPGKAIDVANRRCGWELEAPAP